MTSPGRLSDEREQEIRKLVPHPTDADDWGELLYRSEEIRDHGSGSLTEQEHIELLDKANHAISDLLAALDTARADGGKLVGAGAELAMVVPPEEAWRCKRWHEALAGWREGK